MNRYWEHLESVGDEWALSTAAFRRNVGVTWPVGLYGDDAVIGLQNNPFAKIFGLYFNVPLYRPRATRLSRYLIFAVECDKILSVRETIWPVLEKVTASLNKLAEEGACGQRCLVGEIRGDQAFIKLIFQHTSYWTANQICFRCLACRKKGHPLNYTDYDSWVATRRSTDEFLREEQDINNP